MKLGQPYAAKPKPSSETVLHAGLQAQLRSAAERLDQLQSALVDARSSEGAAADSGSIPQALHAARAAEKQLSEEVQASPLL